jgi:thiol:disulfide interchange protein DsbD
VFIKYFLSFSILLVSLTGYSQTTQYVDMGAQALKIKGKSILAVSFKNDEKWHTYWKNPGDAGLEIKLKMFIDGDKKIELRDYPWPAPTRYIEQGNMWAFGYSDSYSHFFELPENLKNKKMKIVGEWLVCKDICIPGTRTVNLAINDNLLGATNPLLTENKLKSIFKGLPRTGTPKGMEIFLTKGIEENQLALHYLIEDADFTKIKSKASIVTPYLRPLFDYKHEEVYLDKKTNTIYGRIYLEWDGLFEDPEMPLPTDGMFKDALEAKFLIQYPKDQPPRIATKLFKGFTLDGDKELSNQFKGFTKLNGKEKKQTTSSQDTDPQGILSFILFAFLGGLILNLMPCVLPVISLKLFGLIIHSNESKKQILKHNLAYTAGVVSTFMVLAAVVMLIKASGDQIGWGFQLQSPMFVFAMILIIFVMALNMFGLFEFVTPGGAKLGNAQLKKGFIGDFVNGILATILSTPCSAPFLGTALTFAFTTSHFNIFLIFFFVGIGLSFPFILTGFFPALITFLPKPGLWMDKLKKFLGVTLILTAVWLIDVYFSIVAYQVLWFIFTLLLVSIVFAFYFRKKISKKKISNILVFLIPILLTIQIVRLTEIAESNLNDIENSKPQDGIVVWAKWSPEAIAKPPGKYVFMNFTARWCLTCKINKKIVLNSNSFKELAEEKGLGLLEADWTKRNDDITIFLKKYGIVGVPAYFVQKPNGEIISLGETISIKKIKENLD